jgi:transcription termination/antitermination protein NusA
MTLVNLPGLKATIEEISKSYNLPASEVQEALREALLKGYERFRRSKERDRDFSEEYFENFKVQLDTIKLL